MSSFGRRHVPGERNPSGYINQQSVLNRTIRAQVQHVEPTEGYVVLTYEALPGGGRYATVPPLWISFPADSANSGPSWGRYMPQSSDLVKVSFDYDDRPQIVGYDIAAESPTIGDGKAGWPQLNDQYNSAHGNTKVPPERAKFSRFSPLNPGEYDFMSSGGAYIYGNNNGRLHLAGGSVSITMIKNDLRLSSRAQLWSHIADNCDFRFGQVRRVNQVTQAEDKVVIDAAGTFKEFGAELNTTVSPGVSLHLATLKIGNIVDDVGALVLNTSSGSERRFDLDIFSDLGISVFSHGVDNLGNWEVLAPTATVGVNFDFSLGTWTTSFANISHTASTLYQITAPSVTYNVADVFTVNSPSILLGSAAIHPILLTNIYRPAEDSYLTGIVASISALATALATLGTACAAATPPIAAGTGVATAAAAAALIATAAQSAFNGVSATFPSMVTKTQ